MTNQEIKCTCAVFHSNDGFMAKQVMGGCPMHPTNHEINEAVTNTPAALDIQAAPQGKAPEDPAQDYTQLTPEIQSKKPDWH